MSLWWSAVILALTFIAIEAKKARRLDDNLTFNNCDKDSWKVSNMSLSINGTKVKFQANISQSEGHNNGTHQVKFTLTGCNNSTCKDHSNLTVQHFNCSGNATASKEEACMVAKMLIDWAHKAKFMSQYSTNKMRTQACVLHVDADKPVRAIVLNNASDTTTKGTLQKPSLISSISINPAVPLHHV